MHIHYLTGEFARSTSETAFLSSQIERTRAMLGFTLLFCVAFFLSFFVTDIAVLGMAAALRDTLPARLLVAAIAGSWAWLAYCRPLSIRAMRLAASLSEGIALGCFMVVALARPHEVHWHAMSMLIMLVVIYLYIPNRLVYSTALGTGASIVFLALVTFMLPPRPVSDLVTMAMLLVLINTFGILAARRYNCVAREQFRLQMTLKQLAQRDSSRAATTATTCTIICWSMSCKARASASIRCRSSCATSITSSASTTRSGTTRAMR